MYNLAILLLTGIRFFRFREAVPLLEMQRFANGSPVYRLFNTVMVISARRVPNGSCVLDLVDESFDVIADFWVSGIATIDMYAKTSHTHCQDTPNIWKNTKNNFKKNCFCNFQRKKLYETHGGVDIGWVCWSIRTAGTVRSLW